MFYKSFFYECLVNLYFKKKFFLGAFQGKIYLFKNRYIKLVKKTTLLDLLGFVAMGGLLVSGGVFLNYLLSKGK